jgi:hypothetical protein
MSGKIQKKQTEVGLTGEQALEIGAFAGRVGMFPEALNWLLSVAGRALMDPRNGIDLKGVGSLIKDVITKVTEMNGMGMNHNLTILVFFFQHDQLINSITVSNSHLYPYRFTEKLKSQQIVHTYKSLKLEELRRNRKAEISYANFAYSCNKMNSLSSVMNVCENRVRV